MQTSMTIEHAINTKALFSEPTILKRNLSSIKTEKTSSLSNQISNLSINNCIVSLLSMIASEIDTIN